MCIRDRDSSEEFHVLAENGEDTIAISDSSEFAINTELLLKDGEDISSLEGKPSPDGNGTIQIKKGIEVGHIFKLGKLYAESMKANVLNAEGKASTLYMGCYGIGVSRLVAAAIEQNYDDKGIIWPHSIAPFDINIISIGFDKDKKIASASLELYNELSDMGYDVLLDDRKDGYGAKMSDSELIGIPLNIIIGKKYLDNKYFASTFAPVPKYREITEQNIPSVEFPALRLAEPIDFYPSSYSSWKKKIKLKV